MSERHVWKDLLQESNAIGWIAFLLLVIGIGVGSLYFGSPDKAKAPAKTPALNHAAK